jgi:hypothetical protein
MSSLALPVYWPRVHQPLENFVQYINSCLSGNIFMSRDFEAETDVKYTGLYGNCLTRKRTSK